MKTDFRYHPAWFTLCYFCSLLGVLNAVGCGGGKPVAPTHHDYLSSISPVRWPGPEVLYRVYGGPPNPAGSEVRRIVRRGIERWQDALKGRLLIREAQGSEAEQITVRWVKVGSLGGDFFGSQTLGRTTLHVDERAGTISSAVMDLDSQLWGRPFTLERIASHEASHALFLRGHSPYPDDLGYANPSRTSPSQADINTIQMIYPEVSP